MAGDGMDEVEVEWESKRSKLPMILGALTLLVIGAGAGFAGASYAGNRSPSDGFASNASEDMDGDSFDEDRIVHSLGLFTINLRGTGGGRVLRMEVQVEATLTAVAAVENEHPKLRDSVITLVSDYSYAEIEGLDGKTRLRDELLARMNTMLGKNRLERVYFTEFVVQ
jgi:flagellar FliL protein